MSRPGLRLEANPIDHLEGLAGVGLEERGLEGSPEDSLGGSLGGLLEGLSEGSFDWKLHLPRASRMFDYSSGVRRFRP